jgi:hypothetical protein
LHENTPSVFDTATIHIFLSPILLVVHSPSQHYFGIFGIIIFTSSIIFVFFDDIASSPSSSQKLSSADDDAVDADPRRRSTFRHHQ